MLKFDEELSRLSLGIKQLQENPWDSLEENSIDLYASLKSLYLQNRTKQIANSKSSVKTQDDSGWEEIDAN